MKEPIIYEDEYYQDEGMLEFCPNCGREYDQIDWEYQICHYCGFDVEQDGNATN